MLLKMRIFRGYGHVFFTCMLFAILTCVKQVHSATTITKTEGPGNIVVQIDYAKELRVKAGESIALTCTVDGDASLVQALWFGPTAGISFKEILLHPDNVKYTVTVNRTTDDTATEYTIGIRDLRLEDTGNYRCQGINGLTDDVELFVLAPSNITSISELQLAREGDAINLECHASGIPTPQIQWRHVRPNTRLPNGLDGIYAQGIILRINSITLDNRGEYECIASNGLPEHNSTVTRTTYIRMEYKPIIETIVYDIPVVKVSDGQAATITCKSMAYPRSSAADVKWFRNDAELGEGDGLIWEVVYQLPTEEVDLYEETTFSMLQIPEINSNTTGEYKCQFRNSKGFSSATFEVEVGSDGVSEDTSTVTTTTGIQMKSPSNITSISGLQFAREGNAISLECIAEGSPNPQVQWRHVRPNKRLPNGLDGIYTRGINLNITSITLDNRGEYECIASNGVPEDNSMVTRTTFIRMEYKPIVEEIVYETPAAKVSDEQTITLACKSMAYPRSLASDVKWYFDDDELVEGDDLTWEVVYQLPTHEVDLYEETTFSVLQIPEINSNTAGEYRCQFGNSKGSASTIIQVGSETRKAPVGPAIGGAVAGIIIIGIVIIVAIVYIRSKKTRDEKNTYNGIDQNKNPGKVAEWHRDHAEGDG